jgi:hypothetical protein
MAKGLRFLCRHLVGLCVTYRHTTEKEALLPSRFTTCSGTLIAIEGALYFLTAGHVLKALKQLRDSDGVLIEHASLADIFGLGRVSDTPIPFDLKEAQLCFIDDEESGLDFGIIPIGHHHTRLLAKNRVIALSEANWISQSNVRFDGYLMLGFPAEMVSERVSEASTVIIQPTMFAVKRMDVADDQRATTYPRFIGQISPDLPIKSLEGMSGGLILGFRDQPKLSYWVVAIQSSWNPNTRMTYGCSLPVLASLLTHWARDNVAILREIDRNSAKICLTVPNANLPSDHSLSDSSKRNPDRPVSRT